MAVLSLAGRVLIVAILLAGAAGKLTPAGFAAATDMFRQLSVRRGAGALAGLLACVELAAAAVTAIPATAAVGTAAAAGVFAVLTVGVAVVLARGIDVRCACFGSRTTRLRPVHLVRNAAMLGAALGACLTTQATAGLPATPDAIVLAVLLGGLPALVLVKLDDLAAAFALSPDRT